MSWIALKMLTGDRGKYLGIIAGIAFASLLITQQSSIFCGLMLLTSSQIRDVRDAEIWVTHPSVQNVDEVKPLSDNDLFRVRGVKEVAWAVRLYKGQSQARLSNGDVAQVNLMGLDDATLIGAPRDMVRGSLADLWKPDAILIDERGYRKLWPGEPLQTGKIIEINDERAVLVGICRVSQTFQQFPIVYTRYTQALQFTPPKRKMLSFVLAKSKPQVKDTAVCQRIEEKTELQALTRRQFMWKTIRYYFRETGIPVNFGMTVLLGFLVGAAITAQTLYLFVTENLKQFAALKAMGTSNRAIVGMILLQGLVVGAIGYGVGVGLAALFGAFAETTDRLAFHMPWQVLAITGFAVLLMIFLSSLLSIRRVLVLEPGVVFRA